MRRVKCDETRPACLRCLSTRRVCDGYNDIQPSHQPPCNLPVVHVTSGPSFDVHVPSKLKRSFEFFVQRSCLSLAGFFESDFWERLVLQAAYHESAVYHAIVAIGSFHELLEHQIKGIYENPDFALLQYNLAIRELLVPLSQNGERAVDVCLISCILFACFEVCSNSYAGLRSRFYSLQDADSYRICEGIIPRGDYIFEVARSYSEKFTTSSRLESFNIEYLVQRLRMSGMPH